MYKPTEEMKLIIDNKKGNFCISAYAGTGKSSTLIQYIMKYPRKSFLYLVFNKSAKMEMTDRCKKLGIKNVRIETAHSLAYKAMNASNYELTPNLKTYDIAEITDLNNLKDSTYKYILCSHINTLLRYYCNSSERSIHDTDYSEILDGKTLKFFKNNELQIFSKAEDIYNKMKYRETPITHDFYLKEFQLKNPILDYDYILFDEGQDASPVMLDIFLKQKAKKIIVGDTHQQIYGFRYAINSLEKTDFEKLYLTNSFRFNQTVADLAVRALNLKSYIKGKNDEINITGLGKSQDSQTRGVLSRGNIGLLDSAIQEVFVRRNIDVYFEGNINSYTFTQDGTSLYDILNLYLKNKDKIRSKFIKSFDSVNQLNQYIQESEDKELELLNKIVTKYGTNLFTYLPRLRDCQKRKEEANVIFSTVHKAKGLEYDKCELTEDFITESSIIKSVMEGMDDKGLAKIKEEINILYVALTRSRGIVTYPVSTFLQKQINKESN